MADTYRVVRSPRPLVPGTRIVLRVDAGGLRPGNRVLVLLRPGGSDDGPRRVGTVGLVWGIEREDHGPDRLQVRGEVLVAVEAHHEGGRADVVGIERDRAVDPAVLAEVQALLRTYMGATAEAGGRGDIGVTLSQDPVVASHQVASLVRISAPELQEVLEAGDTAARLRRLVAVLRRETGLLRSTMGGRGV
ncbi:MAG TPA: hypothetical protein VLD62_01055 [Acidimicrobiia bacterium]|nr:hypothetical protein [Acidimicrobiia bacterium]